MKITNIYFQNGWNGNGSIKIKARDEEGKEYIIENMEAENILKDIFNAGCEVSLSPGQKIYRLKAK